MYLVQYSEILLKVAPVNRSNFVKKSNDICPSHTETKTHQTIIYTHQDFYEPYTEQSQKMSLIYQL